MASINIRDGNEWNQSSTLKIFRNNSWEDAQGFVYINGSWEGFTEKFFEYIHNSIIYDGILGMPLSQLTLDKHTGFYFTVSSTSGTNSSVTIDKINPRTGATVFSRNSSLSGYQGNIGKIIADENYLYAINFDNIFKFNKSTGALVTQVAKEASTSTAFETPVVHDGTNYVYFGDKIYNKNNLILYNEIKAFSAETNDTRFAPFDNSTKIVADIPRAGANQREIACFNNYGIDTSKQWSYNYTGYFKDLKIRNGFVYLMYSTETQMFTGSYLVKLDSTGKELYRKVLHEEQGASNVRTALAIDNSNNVYAISNAIVEKYDSSGKRRYMYELKHFSEVGISRKQLVDMVESNGEIILWAEYDNKTYSEVYNKI